MDPNSQGESIGGRLQVCQWPRDCSSVGSPWHVCLTQSCLAPSFVARVMCSFIGYLRDRCAAQRTAYRVDVLTSSRTSKDLSEPTAILELRTGQRADAPTSGSGSGGGRRGEGVVRFEMNREQLAAVLKQVEAAEAVIARSTA